MRLVCDTWPPRRGMDPVERTLNPGDALAIGREPIADRHDAEVRSVLAAAKRPLGLRLGIEEPTVVSSVQVIVWTEGNQARVASTGTNPVLVQRWGQPPRAEPLAGLPFGEALDQLTTLWLPSSGPKGKRWRWRIGVVNPNAPFPLARRGPWGTQPDVVLPPLEATQLDAVIARFGDFVRFPGIFDPEPAPYRVFREDAPAVRGRLEGVRDKVRRATGSDRIGTNEDLLAILIERGAIPLRDVAARAQKLGIRLRGVQPILDLDDPRPEPKPAIHPAAHALGRMSEED